MAFSYLTITFNEDLVLGSVLSFQVQNNANPLETWIETWVNLRNGSNKVTKGTPTGIVGQRSAINFAQAFNLDYFDSGFVASVFGKIVTIQSPGPGWVFQNPIALLNSSTSANVVFNITNIADNTFSIDTTAFLTSATPCTHVSVSVTTDVLATIVLLPTIILNNTQNPFLITVLRGFNFQIKVQNANGDIAIKQMTAPSLLNASNFNFLINNSPSGATVIIENTNTTGLNLEYSIDNVVWQSSPTFNGLPSGDYALYVRDQYGCSFEKYFNIDEFGINAPYFEISKSNSFRFAHRITFGDSANYKTDENTLSCEVDVLLPYKETQRFQSADIITTQFRSNYRDIVAKVIKSDASVIDLPIIKKSTNIGNKDKRDARMYNVGNGKTGVYFIGVNTYDYNTNAIIAPCPLNGLLPEWAVIGNYFQISGTWFLIEEVVFDESKNANVIVFANVYLGAEINVITSSIFNRENYEVYEFSIDMVDYIEEKFRVRIENTDMRFPGIFHLSEEIYCKVKHKDVLEIRYKNPTNTDINYSTGIEHLIRVPYIFVKGKDDESSEIHKTDTDSILLNADIYEVEEIFFAPVTKEIWRKIKIALSHKIVSINGVGYVKNGTFATDGPLGNTNLYQLTATMIKTGNVYNSQSGGDGGFDGTQVAVPGLIQTDSGYVSY